MGVVDLYDGEAPPPISLPPGTRVLEAIAWGASAWTSTSKVMTEGADGSRKAYFLKTARERGAIMMEGEHNPLKSIANVNPNLVPNVYGWGKFEEDDLDTYFLIMDFLDLKMVLPDPVKFCPLLADLHKKSESPTGKFGCPMPTCHGKHIQPNGWESSWCKHFKRLLTIFFDIDIEINGPWKEYEEAFEILKPTSGINVETGEPVVFDASVMYAHNEYELAFCKQRWRHY
ncbi:Fructosamine kinase-domain-containing protein [Xylariales sp. AK1849]|nr:Fructosamine kinase-domain-containing protein [Xylariales sp. AK1849]